MNAPSNPTIGKSCDAAVLAAEDAAWVETLPGEMLSVRVSSEAVDGRYTIMDSIVQPDMGTPLHIHAEDEIFRVLEGVATFLLDGKIVEAGPDSIVFIPANVPHCWKNKTDTTIRLSATFVPGGIEHMFMGMNGKQPEELADFVAGYGTVIVGPPLD